MWSHGIATFYGGSTQVHLGPGPGVDNEHARSLRAALLTGGTLELTRPDASEDHGITWADPHALSQFGERETTDPWAWAGPARVVSGRSWGGCLEVLEWVLTAGRFPADPHVLEGGVLLVETSELLLPAAQVGWILRSFGERGLLAAVDAVLVARPPVSDFDRQPDAVERARLRAEQRDVVIDLDRSLQPGRRRVRGRPIRAHPAAVDRAARRHGDTRRRHPSCLRRLLLVFGQAIAEDSGERFSIDEILDALA